ncbi:chitin synthase [Plakobranchus ocellatus]|uniref:chitin synthase n=1 Tax=Plakobranchus ocellatus TaxID=259542 RepID=A0AAV4DEP2_9GAST|nr:chitin synthase [Plakobranchus ocellatus]
MHLDQQKPTVAVSKDNVNNWSRYTGQMLIIFLALLLPYGLQLLRAIKNGLFARSAPWPKATGILACLVVGTLEPLGLILLALKVVPAYGPGLGVLVMGCSVCLSAAAASVLTCAGYGDGTRAGSFMTLATFLLLGGLSGIIYLAVCHDPRIANLLHVVGCLLSLNVAWLPWLQHHMNESSVIFLKSSTEFRQTNFGSSVFTIGSQESVSGAALSTSSSVTSGVADGPSGDSIHTVAGGRRTAADAEAKTKFYKKATWKASIILHLTEIVSTFILTYILFYVDMAGTEFPLQSSFSSHMHDAFLNAWRLSESIASSQTYWAFKWNLISSVVCYILVFLVLHTNMQKGSLGLPLVFSLPLSLLLVSQRDVCDHILGSSPVCHQHVGQIEYLIPTAAALVLGQLFSFGKQLFIKGRLSLLKETELFWTPAYNGAAIDSWLLLNCKQSLRAGKLSIRAAAKPPKMRVYICTTMYREDEDEMRQLLESLDKINKAQQQVETFFESHIVFDGGVQRKKISEFALVLISLLEETLGTKPTMCTKIVTPYGLKLSWALPGTRGKPLMTFNIHLKDNMLVKNKKRWSQIMYMSYVLDFLTDASTPNEEAYILTTDADVKFTPDSVEALLDLMSRDNTIGAVCARTHPMGEGPLVWYQTFEYAVGHWFQKTAEHVMGSVLCAPGCFSVYRCRALRDVLPKYCKKVESAFDFLTKDMGEDRWLCTLMVQSGWRIEYCAASENSTNCPAEFEEFYKQRRRWIASTLANLMLVIREWEYIDLFNERVSVIFLVYQGLLLFSTLIGPSTVIVIVAGGLVYAWSFNSVAAIILQVLTCIGFTLICLYLSQKTQFTAAKILTFVYAAVMCAVAVGTAEKIVDDLSRRSASNSTKTSNSSSTTTTTTARPAINISLDMQVSITTIYFGFLVGVYAVAGLVHPREIFCLLHGVWYLLCLLSGYLILTIYSICNLTDSRWGTREASTASAVVKKKSWHDIYKDTFYAIFFCCDPRQDDKRGGSDPHTSPRVIRSASVTSVATVGQTGSRFEDGGAEQRKGSTLSDTTEYEFLVSDDNFGRHESLEEKLEAELD